MNQTLEPLPLRDFRHWYLVTAIVIPTRGHRDPGREGRNRFANWEGSLGHNLRPLNFGRLTLPTAFDDVGREPGDWDKPTPIGNALQCEEMVALLPGPVELVTRRGLAI